MASTAPLGDAVELRVHGVHGTSPATMLGVSDGEVGQVAGDRLTGVYRAKDSVPLPYRSGRSGVSVEAYSWGALTSGVQGALGWLRRVLWLLLLPFALVNLAHWARLEVGSTTRHRRDVWGARAVRLTGLMLTIFFALSVSVVAVDIVGWQCYRDGVPGCSLPGQLDFLARLSGPGRLAATSVLPMLAIGVLWWLSRTSLSRYEDTPPPIGADVPEVDAPLVLRHPHLWNGRQRTERLQRLHLAAALATIVAFTDLHLWAVSSGGDRALAMVLTVLALAVIAAAAALTLPAHRHDIEYDDTVPAWTERTGWLAVVALVLCALHLVVLGTRAHGGIEQDDDFFGHNLWFIVVFVVMTGLSLAVFTGGRMGRKGAITSVGAFVAGAIGIAVLFALDEFDGVWVVIALVAAGLYLATLNVWHYKATDDHQHQAWRGASASTLLAAASWVALLFTSAVVIAVADYANGSEHGISDVVSDVPDRPEVDGDAFVATGKVTLRDATVVADPAGGPVRILDGIVEVEELSRQATTDRTDTVRERYSVGRGTTRVRSDATLSLPTTNVRYVDSCITDAPPLTSDPCTAEEDSFRTGGALTLAKPLLQVQPIRDGTVVLASLTPPSQPIAVPQVLIWLPLGQLVWVLAVGLAVLVGLLLYWRGAGRRIHQWPSPESAVIPDRDREAARNKRRLAGLAHRAEWFLDVIGVITAPIAMAVIVLAMTGQAPWELWPPLRKLAAVALVATYAVSAGLVFLGSQIRRSEGTRRAVGVIWDLTTFWPRAAHPLAPPCYAERVVPELITRARWALEAPGTDRLVLSGHSQGSLIVAAAASRLTNAELGRIRIVTYGSQIRGLYGRIFPAVIGDRAIGYRPTTGPATLSRGFPDTPTALTPGPGEPAAGSLRQRLETAGGSWVNLFRRTDALGWRVFSDRDSELDIPVPEVPPRSAGDPGPVVMTHSGYQHSPTYRAQVCEWVEESPTPEPTGTSGLTPLPPV